MSLDKKNKWILEIQEEIKNKTIKTLIKSKKINISDKGAIGKIIENLFGVQNNSRKSADLDELGIEIKSTPMKIMSDNTFSSKERIVCSIINYNNLVNESDFYKSDFYKKNKKLLIVFYHYLPNKSIQDYKILSSKIFNLDSLDDIEEIKKDYEIIKLKVEKGCAHLISGSDTKILEACTKGSNSKSMRNQPNSLIKAKQRAFAFKNSFVKKLFYLSQECDVDNIRFDIKNENDFLEAINKYKNFKIEDLTKKFNISTKSKSYRFKMILGILNVDSLDQIKYFRDNNVCLKTIILEENNSIKEHMPICKIDINDIIFNSFENSEFYQNISMKYIIVIFKKSKDSIGFLKEIKTFNFNSNDIKNAKNVFYKTKKVFIDKEIKNLNLFFGSLIKPSYNLIFHIRPKARNKNDTYIINSGLRITKQAFWINKEDLLKKIK